VALEVRTDITPPAPGLSRVWVGWDIVDAKEDHSGLVYGGYFDIYKEGPHHSLVGDWLREAAGNWQIATRTDGAFIFDAIERIMEVIADGKG